MKQYINGERRAFENLMASDISGKIQMLNLLKFKEDRGSEDYKEYMAAANPFFDKSGAKILFYGSAAMSLIGPQEMEWDKVLIIEYPNKEALLKMVLDKDYPAPLRAAALEDSRLILCH